jgi:hypothetical protein
MSKYLSLGTLKYEEVVLIQQALDGLAGDANDMDTLSQVDALQKKIKFVLDQSKTPFRS